VLVLAQALCAGAGAGFIFMAYTYLKIGQSFLIDGCKQ
jgi:hypothetical protein